jgi:hypothetical protein
MVDEELSKHLPPECTMLVEDYLKEDGELMRYMDIQHFDISLPYPLTSPALDWQYVFLYTFDELRHIFYTGYNMAIPPQKRRRLE